MPVAFPGSYGSNQPHEVVFSGSQALFQGVLDAGLDGIDAFNNAGIIYPALGLVPLGSDSGNSNSGWATVGTVMNLPLPDLPGINPLDGSIMLSQSQISGIQFNYYPNTNLFLVPHASINIADIANATGSDVQELVLLNPTVDFNNLSPGQVITLPIPDNSQLDVQTDTSPTVIQGNGSTDFDGTADNVSQGILIDTGVGTVSMNPNDVNDVPEAHEADALAAGNIVTDGYRPGNFNLADSWSDPLGGVLNAVGNFFDGVAQTVTAAFTNVANWVSQFLTSFIDPVVLDLNGDGVKLTNYTEQPVLFDVDHDGGSLEVTGWVTPQDGILVHDLNGNGVIDNIAETLSEFYNGTVGTGGNAGTKPFANGFAALKSLDSNSDNQFTSADTAWNTLRVWVDDNADGLSFKDVNGDGTYQPGTDTSELKTFDELGIASINLTPTTQSGLVNGGNEILATGSFVIGGQTREAQAANFIANPDGHTFLNQQNGTNTGTKVMTQAETGGTSSYVSHSAIGEVMNTATLGVNNLYGGAGNDTLTGDANDNWLAGGVGSDTFNAGDGDDARITRMNRRAMRRELGRDQWNHCYAILMNS